MNEHKINLLGKLFGAISSGSLAFIHWNDLAEHAINTAVAVIIASVLGAVLTHYIQKLLKKLDP